MNGLGYVFIARLDEHLAGLQATWTALGIAAYIGTLLVVRRTRSLERYRYTFMFAGLALLLLPLVPGVGREINGARIWVSLGPVNFQPGEFAKIALAVFFAAYLVEKRELLAVTSWRVGPFMLPDPKHLGPVLLAWGVSLVVMVMEKDLGSSLLFFALFVVMVWVATERPAYLFVGTSLFAVGAYAAWWAFEHVQQRVTIWLDPWKEDLIRAEGFQVVQASYALAFGGLTGTGPGLGSPDRIPAAETDFIFAAIGEELGLVGATAVLAAYLLMVGAGLRIASRAEDPFDKLLATGLSALVGIQAFIIMAGVTRLLPLTGVTLPFISYGGSSLVANYVLLAILVTDLGPERHARRPPRAASEQIRSGPDDWGALVNRQIRRLGAGLIACYVALFAMLNYWQVIEADDLARNPDNTRAVVRDFNRPRGTIETADGVLLARTVETEDETFPYQREYFEGARYGHLLGWFSLNLGSSGLERQYNDELSGQTLEQEIRSFADLFVDYDPTGDVILSLHDSIQRVAEQQLGQREGSVVALDPRSGEVLALWSYPSYDPNLLSTHDFEEATRARQVMEELPGDPLRAHTYQERYFPGSTFKVVTAAAGLDSGRVSPDTPSYPVTTGYVPPLTSIPVTNFGGQACGGTLFPILQQSCNTAFAEMAAETLGPEIMVDGAERFGFNDTPPIDLPGAVRSVFPTDYEQNTPALAQAGIGQYDVQATPLQMALAAAAVANGGEIMTPTVMGEIRDSEGRVLEEAESEVWRRALEPDDAAVMRDAMVSVVESGTASGMAIPGMEVGGRPGPRSSAPTPKTPMPGSSASPGRRGRCRGWRSPCSSKPSRVPGPRPGAPSRHRSPGRCSRPRSPW